MSDPERRPLLPPHSPPATSGYGYAHPHPHPQTYQQMPIAGSTLFYADTSNGFPVPASETQPGLIGSLATNTQNYATIHSQARYPFPDAERDVNNLRNDDEDDVPILPSSTSIYVDPSERQQQDTFFSHLYLICMGILFIAGIQTLLIAEHKEGEEIRKTIYATLYNSSGVLTGITVASVGAGSLWILFMSAFVKPIVWGTVIAIPVACIGLFTFALTDSILGKVEDPPYMGIQYNSMIAIASAILVSGIGAGGYLYRKRKQIDQTISIIQLSCQILWENPSIFVLSFMLMAIYVLFTFLWLFTFGHLFLSSYNGEWSLSSWTQAIIVFFIFMQFWTSAVLQSVEKMTISGVVGQWYFKRHLEDTYNRDQTWRNLNATMTAGFGSVCFSSLILAIVQGTQAFVRMIRKNARGSTHPIIVLVDNIMSGISRIVEPISSYTLVYCGLTGKPFIRSAYLSSRIFRRNMMIGLTTSFLTRTVLSLGSVAAAAGIGSGTFFYAARGLSSPYAYIIGIIGSVIPFYVLRFMSQVVLNTVDATFICYMIDLDTNANNCITAHEIFEPKIVFEGARAL